MKRSSVLSGATVGLLFWALVLHGLFSVSAGALWRDEAISVNQANLPSWRSVWESLQYESCPLLYPAPTGEVCPLAHPAWAKGGCILTFGTTPGARLRHELDRESAEFKALYAQRTACERIFSQAVARGIERPKLRNQRSITNFNTLLYVLLNLLTLQRIQQPGRSGQ